jgi:hypothetical protein
MRNPRQTITLTLAQLQAAGYTSGGDFPIGGALPSDAQVISTEINVLEACASPNLISASATISGTSNPALADLTILSAVQGGGQQFTLSISLVGDTMAALTAGSVTATVYYIQATTPTYQLSEI